VIDDSCFQRRSSNWDGAIWFQSPAQPSWVEWEQVVWTVDIGRCSFSDCEASCGGGAIGILRAVTLISMNCAESCWAQMQGHFAMLALQDGGMTHLSLLSIVSCSPSGALGMGAIEADTVKKFQFERNNFTRCYARSGSAFWGWKDFVAEDSSSYINVYGCSGNAAFRYEPLGGNLTIHHSNFYNNTTTKDIGTIHVWKTGMLSVEWSVFQGNTLDITENNHTLVSDCTFNKDIPGDAIDE
jgi:hypothetical protein